MVHYNYCYFDNDGSGVVARVGEGQLPNLNFSLSDNFPFVRTLSFTLKFSKPNWTEQAKFILKWNFLTQTVALHE